MQIFIILLPYYFLTLSGNNPAGPGNFLCVKILLAEYLLESLTVSFPKTGSFRFLIDVLKILQNPVSSPVL